MDTNNTPRPEHPDFWTTAELEGKIAGSRERYSRTGLQGFAKLCVLHEKQLEAVVKAESMFRKPCGWRIELGFVELLPNTICSRLAA